MQVTETGWEPVNEGGLVTVVDEISTVRRVSSQPTL